MRYRVINEFVDKEDNDTHYKIGDEYPKGNYKPMKKRIEILSKKHSKYNRIFIEEIKEEKKSSKKSKG